MMHLIIGGAASGKSEYAEQCAVALGGEKVYLAAMKPFGEEAMRRIARHRALREGKGFQTLEQYTDIGAATSYVRGKTVLLECLSNLTANELFDPQGAGGEDAAAVILNGIGELREKSRHLIVVTLDVFEDGLNYDASTEAYRKLLADLNIELAKLADRVTQVVYSVPVQIKNEQETDQGCSH